MKKCKRCGEEKEISSFYKHNKMKDGYLNICKDCKREYAKKYNRTDAGKKTERRRNQKPKRKHELKERAKKWRINNPEKLKIQRNKNPKKRKARIAVSNAVRDGRLKKEVCEVCKSEITEAHHDDYSKPLEVRWLCKKHHSEFHWGKDDLNE